MLWAIADGSAEQAGCIYTCQGLKFDYVGIIIGDDFVIRDQAAPFERYVPVYDLSIAAGEFSEMQIADAEHWVELPDFIRASPDLFVSRVVGESMNRRIPNGAWCLFRANAGGTRQGKVVVVPMLAG